MSQIIKKIAGDDLCKYIKSSKFCKISSKSCLIGGKFGFLSIDLSDFPQAKSCQLRFKRISGNGLFSIIKENETFNHNVVSKIGENINLDIENSKKFNILRPSSGIGDIEFLCISLFADTKETSPDCDLRVELNKCIRKGIRTVGNRFFANEGSSITSGDIIDIIETEPPNMYTKNGNGILFAGICEILMLKISTPKIEETPKIINVLKKASEIPQNTRTEGYETAFEHALSFDYKPSEAKEIPHNHDVCIFSDGMSLGRYGAINIPDIYLKQNSRYVLIMQVKNIDGNGKLSINFHGTSLQNHSIYSGVNDTLKIPFTTSDEKSFKFEINRNGPSTGNIWVSRISIVPYSVVFGDINEFFGIRSSGFDNIEYASKRFASMKREVFESIKFDDINAVIAARSFSANSWLNKIQPLFPNIKIHSDMIKVPRINMDPDLLISDLGDLKNVKKIWLNEFQGEKITDQDLKILKNAKVISSSLPNVQFLRNKHNINVLYLPKIWPYVEPVVPEIKDYVLFLNRHSGITSLFIDAYRNSNLPQLVVSGLRGNIPTNIINISEYTDYRTFLGLLLNAKAVIDLSICTHYMSAAIDMAFMAGVPVVTTNQWMSISKPKVHIVPVEMSNGKYSPNINKALLCLNEVIHNKRNKDFDMTSYNLNLYASIKTALE